MEFREPSLVARLVAFQLRIHRRHPFSDLLNQGPIALNGNMGLPDFFLHPPDAPLHLAETQLDMVETTLHLAKATLHLAKATLHLAKATLDLANATLHLSQASLDLAETTLDLVETLAHLIESPIDTSELLAHPAELLFQKCSVFRGHDLGILVESTAGWQHFSLLNVNRAPLDPQSRFL